MMTGITRLFGGPQKRERMAPTGPDIVFGPAVEVDGKRFVPVSEERGWRGEPLGMLVVDEHGSDYVPVPRRPPLVPIVLGLALAALLLASGSRRGRDRAAA